MFKNVFTFLLIFIIHIFYDSAIILYFESTNTPQRISTESEVLLFQQYYLW